MLRKFGRLGSSYGLTKKDNSLLAIRSEKEKLKNVRKTNMTIDTVLDQSMTKRAKVTSNAKKIATARAEKVFRIFLDKGSFSWLFIFIPLPGFFRGCVLN